MAREPTTDECKSQGTQMTLDSYPIINDLKSMGWNLLESVAGMESSINQHEVLNNIV